MNIGYNTADIQQLSVASQNGWGGEVLEVWDGDPAPTSAYTYFDPGNDPSGKATGFYWGDDNCAPVAFAIQPGLAFVLSGFDGGLDVTTSGEVNDQAAPFTTCSGYNFICNPFATAIDIQAISVESNNGWGGEVLEIWDGDPAPTSAYTYFDPGNDPSGKATGFYWGDDNCAPVTFAINPGVGFVLSGFEADLSGSVASPYSL